MKRTSVSTKRRSAFAKRFRASLGKEVEPRFPVALQAHAVQQFVVRLAMGLEEEAEIKQGLARHLALAEQQGDQEATEAAVAFEERVNGFKLHMRQGRLEKERRGLRLVMEEQFQRVGRASRQSAATGGGRTG